MPDLLVISCSPLLWRQSSAGQRLSRVVVVRDQRSHRHDDYFHSAHLTLRPTQIIELFCLRWALQACFLDPAPHPHA